MTPEIQTWLTSNGFVRSSDLDHDDIRTWETKWIHSFGGGHVKLQIRVDNPYGYDFLLMTSPVHAMNIGVAETVAQVDALYRLLKALELEQGPYYKRPPKC